MAVAQGSPGDRRALPPRSAAPPVLPMTSLLPRLGRLASGLGLVLAAALLLLLVVGPATGRYRTLTVLSGSMQPSFEPGSVIVVRPVPVDRLEVGDVITFHAPGPEPRVVTHRIVELAEVEGRPAVRTQGDANPAPDPWVARLEDDVAWSPVASLPWVGHGISALRDPLVSRLLVWLCPLLLGVVSVVEVWRRPDLPAGTRFRADAGPA